MLDISNFYKKKNGYQYNCKACTKEIVYSWREEKIQKRWYKMLSDPSYVPGVDENELKRIIKPWVEEIKRIEKRIEKRKKKI